MARKAVYRPRRASRPKITRPAPDDVEILRSFLNTARVGVAKQEDLPSVESLARWLASQGLLSLGVALTDDDWRRVLGLRSAMWTLLLRGRTTSEDKVAQLEKAGEKVSFRLAFDADGTHRFEPVAEGASTALGGLLGLFVRTREDGRWKRLKACRNCKEVFYDNSRNLVGRWCNPRCGSFQRKQRSRRRRKKQAKHPAK